MDNLHSDLLYLFAQLDFLYTDHLGRQIYQCRCCERVFVLSTAITSYTMPMPTFTWSNSSTQPTPARTPVPAAFYRAFEGEEGDGVIA